MVLPIYCHHGQDHDESGYISPASDEEDSCCSNANSSSSISTRPPIKTSSLSPVSISEKKLEIAFEVSDFIVITTREYKNSPSTPKSRKTASCSTNHIRKTSSLLLSSSTSSTSSKSTSSSSSSSSSRKIQQQQQQHIQNHDDYFCNTNVPMSPKNKRKGRQFEITQLLSSPFKKLTTNNTDTYNNSQSTIYNTTIDNDGGLMDKIELELVITATTSLSKDEEDDDDDHDFGAPLLRNRSKNIIDDDDDDDDNDDVQSGYISPASSEGNFNNDMNCRKSKRDNEDNSGYVSSISDELSEDDYAVDEEISWTDEHEQSISFYVSNMDALSSFGQKSAYECTNKSFYNNGDDADCRKSSLNTAFGEEPQDLNENEVSTVLCDHVSEIRSGTGCISPASNNDYDD